jgi:PPE-repeat protein
MDFGALPPEINSGRMYSGPGSGSLLAAATAWEQLASELSFSASSYGSVIANLTSSGWQGPASTVMAGAVAPYVAWLHNAAAQAEQTAAQAKAAAGSFQTAFSAVVPPPLIAANRTQLTSLIASNFFGQNSPAIAATEAAYDEMWAQDAAVMYGYAGSSASASALTPFSPPPQTTNPAGPAAQSAAVAQAGATGAGHAGALSGLTTALQSLAAPASTSSGAATSGAVPTIGGVSVVNYLFEGVSLGGMALSTNDETWRLIALGTRLAGFYGAALRDFARGQGPFSPFYGIPLPAVNALTASAVTGQASQVSGLSVPPTWAATIAPAADSAGMALAAASAAGEGVATMPGAMLFGETLLGTLAGRAISAAAAKSRENKDKTNNKVVPRSPAAG